MGKQDAAESNSNEWTTSYPSMGSREYRCTPPNNANASSSSVVSPSRIVKKKPSTVASHTPSGSASALGDATSSTEKRYIPPLGLGEASGSYRGTLGSARLYSSSSVARLSASSAKQPPSRSQTARDSERERRMLRGTPRQPATRGNQVSGKHGSSSRGHLSNTRHDAGAVYPREPVKLTGGPGDAENASSVLLSGKRAISLSGSTTPGRSSGNGTKAHAPTMRSASNSSFLFSARGFHSSHHQQQEERASPDPRSTGIRYGTPRDGGYQKHLYPPGASTPLFSHMPRVGSSSSQRNRKEDERESAHNGTDKHSSSPLRNDAGSTYLTATSSSTTLREDHQRSAFSFSSVRTSDTVEGVHRAKCPASDQAVGIDRHSGGIHRKTPITSSSSLYYPQPKTYNVYNDSGGTLLSADECVRPPLFARPVSPSPSQPRQHVKSTGSARGVSAVDVPTVRRQAHSARSTTPSGTASSMRWKKKNAKERERYEEAPQEEEKQVLFYDSTGKRSVKSDEEKNNTKTKWKEEKASSNKVREEETGTSDASEGGEEGKEERSMVYSRIVESIVDDDAGKFGNRYADGDDPNGGNRSKYYVMPTASIDERLEYLSSLDEKRWKKEHARAMKEDGEVRRPETLILTRYGPLKALTSGGENNAPRAIMAQHPASSTTTHPASFRHDGKESSSSEVFGGVNERASVRNRESRVGVSDTVDHACRTAHKESSPIYPITPTTTSHRRPLSGVMSIDKD